MEIKIIKKIIGKTYLSIFLMELPKKYPPKDMTPVQNKPPKIFQNKKVRYFILPTPAMMGAKVRTIGTKRAKVIV